MNNITTYKYNKNFDSFVTLEVYFLLHYTVERGFSVVFDDFGIQRPRIFAISKDVRKVEESFGTHTRFRAGAVGGSLWCWGGLLLLSTRQRSVGGSFFSGHWVSVCCQGRQHGTGKRLGAPPPPRASFPSHCQGATQRQQQQQSSPQCSLELRTVTKSCVYEFCVRFGWPCAADDKRLGCPASFIISFRSNSFDCQLFTP